MGNVLVYWLQIVWFWASTQCKFNARISNIDPWIPREGKSWKTTDFRTNIFEQTVFKLGQTKVALMTTKCCCAFSGPCHLSDSSLYWRLLPLSFSMCRCDVTAHHERSPLIGPTYLSLSTHHVTHCADCTGAHHVWYFCLFVSVVFVEFATAWSNDSPVFFPHSFLFTFNSTSSFFLFFFVLFLTTASWNRSGWHPRSLTGQCTSHLPRPPLLFSFLSLHFLPACFPLTLLPTLWLFCSSSLLLTTYPTQS